MHEFLFDIPEGDQAMPLNAIGATRPGLIADPNDDVFIKKQCIKMIKITGLKLL